MCVKCSYDLRTYASTDGGSVFELLDDDSIPPPLDRDDYIRQEVPQLFRSQAIERLRLAQNPDAVARDLLDTIMPSLDQAIEQVLLAYNRRSQDTSIDDSPSNNAPTIPSQNDRHEVDSDLPAPSIQVETDNSWHVVTPSLPERLNAVDGQAYHPDTVLDFTQPQNRFEGLSPISSYIFEDTQLNNQWQPGSYVGEAERYVEDCLGPDNNDTMLQWGQSENATNTAMYPHFLPLRNTDQLYTGVFPEHLLDYNHPSHPSKHD